MEPPITIPEHRIKIPLLKIEELFGKGWLLNLALSEKESEKLDWLVFQYDKPNYKRSKKLRVCNIIVGNSCCCRESNEGKGRMPGHIKTHMQQTNSKLLSCV